MYWVLKRMLVGPWLLLLWRPKVEGRRNVPRTGPAIIASNHLAFLDPVFMPLVVRRHVTFIAKSEYFTGKGVKGLLSRLFFRSIGVVPVDRSGGRSARASLDTLKSVLDEGRIVGYYPEGTRSPDGRLYRGKTGVGRLALETGVPVIPVAMINMHELQPPGRKVPRFKRVRIRFGKPLEFTRYHGLQADKLVQRSVTDEIMYELMKLSDQEYVDTYAVKPKARRGDKPAVADRPAEDSARPADAESDPGLPPDPVAA